MHLFGRAELSLQLDNRFYILIAVASLSDSNILLLKWYEPDEQYRILARLPYSDVLSLSANSVGLGRTIYLCLATTEFAWGDQSYAIEQRAHMTFIKPSGSRHDVEKTESALYLLQEKAIPIEGACDAPAESIDGGLEAASQAFSESSG